MDKDVWKEAVRKDANEEVMRSYNRCKGRVCTEEGEGVFIVKRGERGSEGVYKGAVEERIYLAIQIITDGASILCGKEG